MRSKRQTTMAKLNRERSVKEKREKKREKKEARAEEKARIAAGLPPLGEELTDEEIEAGAETEGEAAPGEEAATEEAPPV
jgi:hypothetical protein